MTLVNLGWRPFPLPIGALQNGLVLVTTQLNATNLKYARSFLCVPGHTAIDEYRFEIPTVTTAQSLAVSIQGIDLTSGDPDGVVIGSTATIAVPAVGENVAAGLGVTGLTPGRVYVAVVEWTSTTGDLLIRGVTVAARGAYDQTHWPSVYAAAAWGAKGTTNTPVGRLASSGGVVVPTYPGWLTFGLSSPTSINEAAALRFKSPIGGRLIGFEASSPTPGANVVMTPTLWDDSGTVLSAGDNWDEDQGMQNGSGPGVWYLGTGVTIAAATFYKLGFAFVSGGATNVTVMEVRQAADLDAYPLGQDGHLATRAAGVWTSSLVKLPMIGPIFDQIDVPAGGGLLRANMSGGLL